jgi:phosphate-selective porin OprO/OprP
LKTGVFGGALAIVALLSWVGPAGAAEDLQASWSNGIRLKSADGSVSLRLGGRLHYDGTFQQADDDLEAVLGEGLQDGNRVRRIRIYFSGVFHDRIEFKSQLDFANDEAGLKDAFVGLRNLPGVSRLLFGHQFEPQGLNVLTSSKYITFVERALPSVFFAERRTGVRAMSNYGPVLVQAMASRNSDKFGAASESGATNLIGRAAVVPVRSDDGRQVLHLGASASRREPGTVSYDASPENSLAPDLVDTGDIAADEAVVWGAEVAAVLGSFSAQGEFVQSRVTSEAAGDPVFGGWYVQGSFFLTGEHRPYDAGDGAFGRVKPKRPYAAGGGWGAWEVAARWSNLDLNDGMVSGGKLDDLTVALNWYQTASFRWMANWILADLDGAGRSNALLFRFATDF